MAENESARDVFLVYRSHDQGPLSKRVAELPGTTVLGWFQRAWANIQASRDPSGWLMGEIGARIYGFESVFEAALERGLEAPQSWEELRDLLHVHLYVEGGPQNIRMDEHALRVRTDDDEVDLAYFFFDRGQAERHRSRVAYLLHEPWNLPHEAAREGQFDAGMDLAPLRSVLGPCRGDGAGTTYFCFMTFYDSDSLANTAPLVLPGVRLPELPAFLCNTLPVPARDDNSEMQWPLELRLLRAMLSEGDRDLERALRACCLYPLGAVGQGLHRALGASDHAHSRTELEEAALGKSHRGDPEQSLIACHEHLAQVSMHCSASFGYQQWFIFDDLWAAANPDLARSLLLYAMRWDPFGQVPPPGEEGDDAEDRISAAASGETPHALRMTLAQDVDARVRVALARGLGSERESDEELAQLFTRDPDAEVRAEVVGHLDDGDPSIAVLARDQDQRVRLAVAKRLYAEDGAVDRDLLAALAGDESAEVRAAAVDRLEGDDAVLAALARDRDDTVRARVAACTELPELLELLAADRSAAVQREAARNPCSPPGALARLGQHVDPEVRAAIAGNASTPAAALAWLARDPDEAVLVAAFVHPKMPPEAVVEKANTVADTSPLALLIAASPACPVAVLEAWSRSPVVALRRRVACAPNSPDAVVKRLEDDPDPGVRLTATKLGPKRRRGAP